MGIREGRLSEEEAVQNICGQNFFQGGTPTLWDVPPRRYPRLLGASRDALFSLIPCPVSHQAHRTPTESPAGLSEAMQTGGDKPRVVPPPSPLFPG